MDLKLNKKTVLVTASTGGIGLEIARYLALEGATVLINGRTSETVVRACEDIKSGNPDIKLVQLVADNGTTDGFNKTTSEFPQIDVLVNNLGIYESVEFFDTTDAQWQHLFEVNVLGAVRLSRHYLKRMLAQNSGRIVFISSESAINPAPEMAHYSATKLMQLSVSRSLAELTKGTNVTVNTIMPGSEYSAAEKRFMRENRPTSLIGRLILPHEIAAFVAFVCSPLASAINGACLRVDGGLIRSAV
jgi:3-oxoacyl-[acyl-carrier protein] reductase